MAHKGGPNGWPPAIDPESAIAEMRDWNPRKAAIFNAEQLRATRSRLDQNGWLQ